MADVAQTTFKQRLQMAGVIAGTVLTFNALFWFASNFYYQDKPLEAADLGSVRLAFGTLSLIVAATAYGAALAPRLIGHGLAVLTGIAAIVGGIASFAKGLQPVMATTLLVVGVLMPVLAYKSLQGARSAWSFLVAFAAVFGIVTFFGAPKVRHLLDINLWHALIIPGVQTVCVIALSMLRGEYRD